VRMCEPRAAAAWCQSAPSQQPQIQSLIMKQQIICLHSPRATLIPSTGVTVCNTTGHTDTSTGVAPGDGSPPVIRDITPLKLDLMRRYITHCQCITVSQSHHYPKCPHDIIITVSAKCAVSMFPNTTKWIIDWRWLVAAGAGWPIMTIFASPSLSPRHQALVISTPPHIALHSLDDTTNKYNEMTLGTKCVW
jgi:hypothetical protein